MTFATMAEYVAWADDNKCPYCGCNDEKIISRLETINATVSAYSDGCRYTDVDIVNATTSDITVIVPRFYTASVTVYDVTGLEAIDLIDGVTADGVELNFMTTASGDYMSDFPYVGGLQEAITFTVKAGTTAKFMATIPCGTEITQA